jgi:hypothetical protein
METNTGRKTAENTGATVCSKAEYTHPPQSAGVNNNGCRALVTEHSLGTEINEGQVKVIKKWWLVVSGNTYN